MMLYQALRYPFQGKGWLRRLIILTSVQLIPIVGQVILVGYGLDIVRAVYAEQIDLPHVRWLSALIDGLRFLVAGLLYITPLLLIAVTIGANKAGSSGGIGILSVLGILLAVGLPLLVLLIRMVSVRRTSARRSPTRGGGLRPLLSGLLPILALVLTIVVLRVIVSSVDISKPNGLTIVLLVILSLLVFLIGIGLCIGAARYAIENKGLFAPTSNLKLLLKHRVVTGALLLNVLLLDALAVLVTSVGLVLLILPGLFAFVVCSLALWYLFARYGMEVGLHTSGITVQNASLDEEIKSLPSFR